HSSSLPPPRPPTSPPFPYTTLFRSLDPHRHEGRRHDCLPALRSLGHKRSVVQRAHRHCMRLRVLLQRLTAAPRSFHVLKPELLASALRTLRSHASLPRQMSATELGSLPLSREDCGCWSAYPGGQGRQGLSSVRAAAAGAYGDLRVCTGVPEDRLPQTHLDDGGRGRGVSRRKHGLSGIE